MSYAERNTWIYGAIAVLGLAAYLVVVLPRLREAGAADVAYEAPMLWTIGGAILAGILGGIVLGAVVPRGEAREDVRDRELGRLGDRVGQGALVLGALAALVLALRAAEPFWIANAIYLGFVASAILSSIVRILAYRGVGPW